MKNSKTTFRVTISGAFLRPSLLKKPAFYRGEKMQYVINQYFVKNVVSCYFVFSPVIFSVRLLLLLLLIPRYFSSFHP